MEGVDNPWRCLSLVISHLRDHCREAQGKLSPTDQYMYMLREELRALSKELEFEDPTNTLK